MNGHGDTISFRCNVCGQDLAVCTDGLSENTPFVCVECGAEYGTWGSIRLSLTQLLREQAEALSNQDTSAPASTRYLH